MIGLYLAEIQLFENLRVQKKITFNVVQMKFLAMHITNQKLIFDIYGMTFTIHFMEHDLSLIS